jgi:hypothetical protein
MIAKVTHGQGFKGLQSYLLTGKDGRSPDRVAWVSGRNLPSTDPEIAASFMRATANESARVEKPVYHLTLNLAPEERLGREAMLQVVDRTLRDLGLAQHQALIVAHKDTAHQHVHVMVNRVHPETGRSWHTGHDYARLERSLRHQELELGLRQVPGRHSPLPDQERHTGVMLSSGDRRRSALTGERSFAEHVREVTRRDLQEARSWGQLHTRLQDYGLYLEKRGRGLVVTDGQRRVKASFVDRGSSLGRLQSRLGSFEPPRGRVLAKAQTGRWREIHELRQTATRIATHRTTGPVSREARAPQIPAGEVALRHLISKTGAVRGPLRVAGTLTRAKTPVRQREPKTSELSQTAMGLVNRLGWHLVARVVPAPHLQLLRLTISISRKVVNASLEMDRSGRR